MAEGKAGRLLERLQQKNDRTKVSLYLSEKLFADFKRCCADVSASQVMEELMREFVEDRIKEISKSGPRSKKKSKTTKP